MTEAERNSLNDEWLRNEAELGRLADLPAGAVDPVKREQELLRRQDEIEYELGQSPSVSDSKDT